MFVRKPGDQRGNPGEGGVVPLPSDAAYRILADLGDVEARKTVPGNRLYDALHPDKGTCKRIRGSGASGSIQAIGPKRHGTNEPWLDHS